jgi:hypothetical protein
MIDQIVTMTSIGKPLRDGHADRRGDALAEWTRGGFDTRRMTVFRMTWRLRTPLPEGFELIERDVGIAGQMEQGIEQHRTVPGRKHEAIPVGPRWIFRIKFQETREQHGCHIGHPHRHAGMTRLGLLDRIDRQEANGVRKIAVVYRTARCSSL